MNVYLAIVAKKGKGGIKDICPIIETQIHGLIQETLFDYIEPTSSIEYSDTGKSALFLFSIRDEKMFTGMEDEIFNHFAITNSGYPMNQENYIQFLHNNACSKECVKHINGIFSLCVLDKHEDEVRAYNNHMRLENVYYAENEYFYFLSTRALLLNILISESKTPIIDKNNLVAFMSKGYIATKGTAFMGVTEMPIYSELKISPDGISISSIEELNNEYFTLPLTDELCDEITHELLKAAQVIKPLSMHAKIGLTGGKDSRMMVLAMNKVGADIETETIGYEDTPDVVVAKKVAETLGIKHRYYYNATVNNGIMEQDILGRTQRVLFSGDCSVSGYEGCAGNRKPYATDYAMFNGLGGEILRGGYSRFLNSFSPDEVKKTAQKIYGTYKDFFQEDAFTSYEKSYLEYYNYFPINTPPQFRLFLCYRTYGKMGIFDHAL